MDKTFWESRWAENQLGFHLNDVNPHLVAHHEVLRGRERVLVPLCGKSHDLSWLAARGHDVIGVELVERAVLDFFAERALTPERAVQHGVTAYRAGAVTLLCADILTLRAEQLGAVSGVWDRAALIALPAPMRLRYVRALRALAPSAALLLVTLDHGCEFGPPFAVTDEEVRAHFGASGVRTLAEHDVTAESPNLCAKGATAVFERVYTLEALGPQT